MNLKREMKKKTGGGAGGQEKFWGAMAHPAPP